MSPIIRAYDAAIGETIEIRWMRRIPDPGDPKKYLTEILTTRHTAPPASVWDAAEQAKRERDQPHE